MTTNQKPKRKPHRRGQARLSGPTGACRAAASAERQCCICRSTRPQSQLLQLDLAPPEAGAQPAVKNPGRRSYVCVAKDCFAAAAKRMAGKKVAAQEAQAAFVVPLTLLATTRLIETIGLARRQGLLVMGAARIVALRPSAADLYVDGDGYDDDDDDDDGAEDDTLDSAVDVAGHTRASAAAPEAPPTDTAVGGGHRAQADISSPEGPTGRQDIIVLALDAARRTARSLGPTALPSMLCGADMGRAAGGAPVAAVGIPAGRLALQAAYWLRVWYEARAVGTTPESMMN